MAISDKIASIQNHLKDDWDSVESLIGDTELDKNIENISSALDALYNDLPKVTGSGTTITLDGTRKGRLESTLKGNTSQTTYSGKNLFNYAEAIASSQVSKSIVNDEMIIKRENSGGGYVAILVSNLEIGENYTLTCDGRVYVYRGAVYSEVYDSVNNAKNGWSFEADQTSYTIAIIINSNEIPNVGDTMNCGKVQLEKGSSATSFEPYVGGIPSPSPQFPQLVNVVSGSNQITICGENLAEFDTTKDTTKYTYSSFKADDISVTKTETGGSFYASFILHIPAAGSYALKYNIVSTQQFYIYSDRLWGTTLEQWTTSTPGDNSKAITFAKGGDYILGLYGSAVANYSVKNLMLVPSGSTISYEPYKGATYPIDLPSGMELCKIGNYQDYFYKDNGNWYKYGYWGKATYTGASSENWTLSGTTSSRTVFYTSDISNIEAYASPNDMPNLMSDHFIPNTQQATWVEGNVSRRVGFDYIVVVMGAGYTEETFRTWLASNNINIYYKYATPTTAQITDTTLISQLEAISKAMSVSGQTNIMQNNNDLPFIISASALLDASTYIAQLEAQIEALS